MGKFLGRLAICFFIFHLTFLPLPVSAHHDPSGSEPEDTVHAQPLPELRYVEDPALYEEKWDELGQPRFWREIIHLTPDSCMLNLASNRQILDKVCRKDWHRAGSKNQQEYLADLKKSLGIAKEERIYVTPGKSDFYDIDKVIPEISKVLDIFVFEGVNPWYAQAIMLIESPGKLRKSYCGAYGSFQLMKSVARECGLVVNGKVDERKDLKKSAQAASRFIRKTCIPAAYRILNRKNIPYDDTDLWFRLLVLHIYHAGAANVNAAVATMEDGKGGMELIKKLWHTTSLGFGNASQNYSQIALASLMEMEAIVKRDYRIKQDQKEDTYLGKFYFRTFQSKQPIAEAKIPAPAK